MQPGRMRGVGEIFIYFPREKYDIPRACFQKIRYGAFLKLFPIAKLDTFPTTNLVDFFGKRKLGEKPVAKKFSPIFHALFCLETIIITHSHTLPNSCQFNIRRLLSSLCGRFSCYINISPRRERVKAN